MSPTNNYTDLLIRIEAFEAPLGGYPVEAILGDGSFFFGGKLELDHELLLQNFSDPQQYGTYLFTALFRHTIWDAYQQAQKLARVQSWGRLRLRLWIDPDAAELHSIRWERLYHHVPLAAVSRTPFSRYMGLEQAEPHPLTARPVKILIVLANPNNLSEYNLTPVDVCTEIEIIYEVLGDLRTRRNDVQVTILPGRSFAELPATLLQKLEHDGYTVLKNYTTLDNLLGGTGDYHVLHFTGHGSFGRRGGRAVLFLEDEAGKVQLAKDEAIIERLHGLAVRPHLFFLVACESGVWGANELNEHPPEHAFIGLAPKLVQAGVPAVVAMQDKVSVSLTRELTAEFYRHLQQEGIIDVALNKARHLLTDSQGWDIPVLFMRLQSGKLLVTNPERAVLQALQQHPRIAFFNPQNEAYLPLPIEVLHHQNQDYLPAPEMLMLQQTATVDLLKAVQTVFEPGKVVPLRPQLVILLGGDGTNKTTQLDRIMWHTIERSLNQSHPPRVLPVRIDLSHYESMRAGLQDPIEALMLQMLQPFWPGLTGESIAQMVDDPHGPIFRLLFVQGENLPQREISSAWQKILQFMRRHRRHQYLIVLDPEFYNPHYFQTAGLNIHLLVIQSLTPRKVRHFLETYSEHEPACQALLWQLNHKQMFDLAAIPWFLLRLIQRAKAGELPQSRTEIVQRIIGDAMAQIPIEQGMRSHAERVINILAWQMQANRQVSLSIQQVFEVMLRVRDNRGYNVETFYQKLLNSRLIVQVGQSRVRFTYPPLRHYCCAQALLQTNLAQRNKLLDNITATFGRLNRLRWWEETFVFLSGLLAHKNSTEFKALLQPIIYGVNLLENEQAFLAARCMLERQEQTLNTHVVDALTWRLDQSSDLRQRIRAATLLGQIGSRRIIERLVTIAQRKVRIDRHGQPDYEFGGVRMAAVVALQRLIETPEIKPLLETVDPQLITLLELWRQKKLEGLVEILYDTTPDVEPIQAIAALALGDLQAQFAIDPAPELQQKGESIINHLLFCFFEATIDPGTLWAITHALAALDTVTVTQQVITRFLENSSSFTNPTELEQIERYKCLIHLIGQIRCQDPNARNFLLNYCLQNFTDVGIRASAIEAVGWLADKEDKSLLESLALGDFAASQLTPANNPTGNKQYLQVKAMDALAQVGDVATLNRLQAANKDWPASLHRCFYRLSEKIFWRLNEVK